MEMKFLLVPVPFLALGWLYWHYFWPHNIWKRSIISGLWGVSAEASQTGLQILRLRIYAQLRGEEKVFEQALASLQKSGKIRIEGKGINETLYLTISRTPSG